MAVSIPLLTKFSKHHRLESCGPFRSHFSNFGSKVPREDYDFCVWREGLDCFQVRSQDSRQQCPTGYGEVLGQDSFQGRPLGRHPFRWATGKKRRKCERKALLWMPRQIRRFLQTSTCRGTIPDITHFAWLLRLLLLDTINVFVLKGSFDIIRQASLLSTYFRHTTPKACWIDETSIGFIAFSRNFFRLDVYL